MNQNAKVQNNSSIEQQYCQQCIIHSTSLETSQ